MSDIPWWWMLLNNLRISCWTITFGSLISSNYLVTWSIFLTNNVDLSKHVYKDIFDRFIPCHFSSTCQQVKNQVIFWNLQDSYGHKLVRCWSPSVSLTSLHPASRLSICRSPLRRQSDWSFGRWLAILCQSLRVQVSLFAENTSGDEVFCIFWYLVKVCGGWSWHELVSKIFLRHMS